MAFSLFLFAGSAEHRREPLPAKIKSREITSAPVYVAASVSHEGENMIFLFKYCCDKEGNRGSIKEF